jgi:hypothetical protein
LVRRKLEKCFKAIDDVAANEEPTAHQTPKARSGRKRKITTANDVQDGNDATTTSPVPKKRKESKAVKSEAKVDADDVENGEDFNCSIEEDAITEAVALGEKLMRENDSAQKHMTDNLASVEDEAALGEEY